MVAHRKNVPPRQGYVPSSWFIVLTVMVVIGAGGWLGWLLLDDGTSSADAASPTSTTTSEPASPAPTTASADPTEDEPTPAPTETSATPDVTRDAMVSVLNNSGVAGAARAFSAKVAGAGWTLGGIGNWTGSIDGNTIYYPADLQDQAELLSDDVDIQRVRPSVAPMRMDRLTIILSGPQ